MSNAINGYTDPGSADLLDKTFDELNKQYAEQAEPILFSNISNNHWDRPILFDEIETPEIAANLLPQPFNEFAAALANATETPAALSVMSILGVIAVAATKRFKVSPKEGWQEPVNIYTLIALPPANHKSLVLKSCMLPLIEWEQEQATLYADEIKRQNSERKTQEKLIDSLRKKVSKEKNCAARQKLMDEINTMEFNLTTPAVLPVLFANDTTTEALANHTFEQGGRFAIFSDEGGITETLAGLYSNGHANVDILLKGIDGGDLRVYRKDRHFHLNPFLTIVLTVQPNIIQKVATKNAFNGNGLLERFLYVLPKSKLGYRTHDKPAVPAALQVRFNQRIKALLNINSLHENHIEQTRLLTLSAQAFKIWHDFQTSIESKLRPNGELALCQGWGGKLAGFTLRLAALLHIAEHADQLLVISESAMHSAVTLANLLIQHAIAAYSLMGIDQPTEDAKEVFQWIQTQAKASFTQSYLSYAMRNRKLGKGERLTKAVQILIERNLIKAERLATRKPTTLFHVHPEIVEQK
jgi:hypothetical protein